MTRELRSSNVFTLSVLREANRRRLRFPNPHGEVKHSGDDWSLSDYFTALMGELGEAANIAKKIRRNDFTLDQVREKLASELADMQIYLDMLADKAGINLADATIKTWNAESTALNIPLQLEFIHTTFGANWYVADYAAPSPESEED